jgi:hypothetical protein
MSRLMEIHGDSYCGIYCGSCPVRLHGGTGHSDAFVSCCTGVPKSELVCGGCKSERVYAGCRVCSFRDCAVERGLERCSDCPDYPCAAYRKWSSVKWFLPHVAEAPPSLEAVRREGVEAWAEAQRKRWSCPHCGAPFSWYQARCGACDRDLADVAYAMKGLRRLVCRLVLPRVYRKGKKRGAARP